MIVSPPDTLAEALERIASLEAENQRLAERASAADLAEERLNLALSAGQVAWWEMDVPTGRVRANEYKALMLGRDPAFYGDCHYTDFTALIHPDDYDRIMDTMRGHLEGRLPAYECEYRIKKADGSWVWYYDKGTVRTRSADGHPLSVKGVVMDITALRQALDAKDFLFQELHHRVKNNLNLINMLIYELSTKTPHEETQRGLRHLSQRIYSVGLLYDLLNRTGKVDRIDLAQYLDEMTQALLATYKDSASIGLELSLEPVLVPYDKAIKLGMIVNELMTNSIKYGLGSGKGDQISLQLSPAENDPETLVLRFSNSGPALDEERWRNSHSLGHLLIISFTKDLEGSLDINPSPHPVFTFTLPGLATRPEA